MTSACAWHLCGNDYIPVMCSCLIIFSTSIACEKNAFSMTKHQVLRFLPVDHYSSSGSIRDNSYWTSRMNSLELILSFRFPPVITLDQ